MSQPAPLPRKSRWRRGVLLGAVALLILAALAVVFRTQIASRLATAYLESQGIAVHALTVTELTPGSVAIADLALGEADELTAERIALLSDIEGFDFRVQDIRIEGLRLTLDATGEAPPLGSLQGALDELATSGGNGNGAAIPPSLPRITLADAEVVFKTTAGPLAATLVATATAESAEMTLQLPGDAESIDLRVSADRPVAPGGHALAVAIQGELRTAGRLAGLLDLPGPDITAGTLVIDAAGRIEPATGLTLSGDAVLGGVALADGSAGISAHLPFAAEMTEDAAVLTLREYAAVRVERPAPTSLRALGVPEDLLPLLASGLNLTLAADGELPFRLTATPAWPPQSAEIAFAAEAASDQGLSLALTVDGDAGLGDGLTPRSFAGSLTVEAAAEHLTLGGREARGVALSLPLAADYSEHGLSLALSAPGRLRIDRFGAGTPLQLKAPLAFAVDTLELTATADAPGYSYALAALEDGAAFAVAAAGGEPLAVDAGALDLRLEGRFDPADGHDASLTARLDGLALPGHGFSAEAAEVDVALDPQLRPAHTRFGLGPFQLTADQPLTAPLRLRGTLTRAGAGYDLAGELALPEGPVLADLTGRYRDDGRASLAAESRLISFVPDGLQPAALSPLLAELEAVRGTISASARLAWPREPSRESGRLSLAGLSFKSGGTEVEGLDLTVELDSLLPLASAAGQRLTIRRLTAGVPVSDIDLVFSLDQAPRPHLSVEDGGFDLGGARWHIAPTEIDPASARNRVVLKTDSLDLATFFDLIEIDGLSGSGTLAGSLPVVFAGNDVIIDNGHFDALGSGRLSIRFQALRSALAGGGETVEAAARALEDFHYEELSLSLAKTADNDATVKLSTLGQNPEVMEGQPFRFNINLESNLTSVLDALRQGYQLSDDALRRAWRLRQ